MDGDRACMAEFCANLGRVTMTADLGIIEGYYGTPWSTIDRERTIEFLAPHGYRFFIYAPKAESLLRRRWQAAPTTEEIDGLARLAATCARANVRFGVGISPLGADRSFDAQVQRALADKLALCDELGAQIVGLLFDDYPGGRPDLAEHQADIAHWLAARTRATQIIVCPTYYSTDPRLDLKLGTRPERYVERLGARLDPAIDVFWTGEQVCAREQPIAHLDMVGEQLRRKPVLWDNYPVNDGPTMSQHLHLRAFTGRTAALADVVRAHAINPALQPTLSCIPALTLAEVYRRADTYSSEAVFDAAARAVVGEPLAALLREDLGVLQDVGRDRLGPRTAQLRVRYGATDHPAAREILAWLDGAYRFTEEIV